MEKGIGEPVLFLIVNANQSECKNLENPNKIKDFRGLRRSGRET